MSHTGHRKEEEGAKDSVSAYLLIYTISPRSLLMTCRLIVGHYTCMGVDFDYTVQPEIRNT